MHALLSLASITDKVVEPIVDIATEFIGSAGVVAAPTPRRAEDHLRVLPDRQHDRERLHRLDRAGEEHRNGEAQLRAAHGPRP